MWQTIQKIGHFSPSVATCSFKNDVRMHGDVCAVSVNFSQTWDVYFKTKQRTTAEVRMVSLFKRLKSLVTLGLFRCVSFRWLP